MIKIFLSLLAIHGVFTAPAIPFAEYGLPSGDNLNEKIVPLNKLPSSKPILELPGSKNLEERSQLPIALPGTRNLQEKVIPDRIALQRIPAPPQIHDLPSVDFNREIFHPIDNKAPTFFPDEVTPPRGGILQNDVPQTGSVAEAPKLNPSPFPIEEGTVLQATEVFPAPKPQESEFEVKLPNLHESPSTLTRPKPIPAPVPEHFTSGEEIQGTSVDAQPSDVQGPLVIQPGTKVKLQDGSGQYSHGFANPDGTEVQESGHLISTNDGWEYVLVKEGSYSYISPEGYPINVRYIADQNGFRILNK